MSTSTSTLRPKATQLTVKFWVVTAVLLITSAIVVAISPKESILGSAIRVIYVHVSLIWIGMFTLTVAGVLGGMMLIKDTPRWYRLMFVVSWVGFGFYTAGVGFSMIASDTSWGAVFYQEPRMATALNMVAVGMIVMIILTFLPPSRFTGILPPMYATVLLTATTNAELILHPRNPIKSSSSWAIQLTFFVMTLIYGATAVWIIIHWYKQKKAADGQ